MEFYVGLEKLKNQDIAKSPEDYEKAKILALINLIKNSDLVASVEIVWASDLEKMAQSMTTGFVRLNHER